MDIKKLDQKLDRKALKAFFVKNAIPKEGDFKELIDGMINQKDDGIVKLPDEPLSLQADGSANSQKKVINFYGNFADPKPAWTLSLNPYADPNDPVTARPGWSIGDADGKSRLFIDQSTGNVGIGTTTPRRNLQIGSDVDGLGFELAQHASPNVGVVRFGDNTGWKLHFGRSRELPGGELNAGLSGVLMTIKDNGYVGIGTSDPKGKLEVNGVAVISNGHSVAAGEGLMVSGSLTVGGNTTSYGGGQGWISNIAGLLLETAASTEIAVHDSGTRVASLMYYEGDAANRITIGRDMGWGAIGQVVLNGNVGIGTTNPLRKLQVDGGLYSSGDLLISGTGKWDPNQTNPAPNFKEESWTYACVDLLDRTNDRVWHISHRNAPWVGEKNKLMFWYCTNTCVVGKDQTYNNVMTLTPDGQVGIGTSDPKAKLDVNGMARIASVFNAEKDPDSGMTCGGSLVIKSNAPQIDFINTEHNDWSIHVDSNKMYFIRQPWIYSDLVLDGAGSVGIGTDTPKGKLEVNGVAVISNGNCEAASSGYMAPGSITVGGITTSYGGGQGWTSNTAGLLFETAANTEIAVHDSCTRVASLMYYEGDANRITIGRDMGWGRISQVVFAGAITPAMGNSSTAGIQFPADPGGGAGDTAWIRYYPRQGESCTLELGVSNDADDHIALMSSGNVGIGTAEPKAKLDVIGNGFFTGDLTVGARGGGTCIKVRHINGKDHLSDNDDALFLNWNTGKTVVIGRPEMPAALSVYGDIEASTLTVKGDVGTGTLRAKAMRVTHHVANVKTGVGLSTGSWLDFPELVVSFQLGGDADVNVFYGIAICGLTPFIGTPVGDLRTRLNLDGHELPETRCATGQSDFMAVSSVWVGTLASGSHTFKVEYFAEKPIWLQLSDGEKGTLMVTVYGVG